MPNQIEARGKITLRLTKFLRRKPRNEQINAAVDYHTVVQHPETTSNFPTSLRSSMRLDAEGEAVTLLGQNVVDSLNREHDHEALHNFYSSQP